MEKDDLSDILGFSHKAISRVYRESLKKEKISTELQFSGENALLRMARLLRVDRNSDTNNH